MSHFDRLVLTLAIIFVSLSLGYSFRHWSARHGLSDNFLANLRKKLQVSAIFALLPASAMLSLWGLPQPDKELFALPFLGLSSYIWGGLLAIMLARLFKFSRAATGSYYCCGTFTNIGAVGGLVCLVFLGENSIALVALYRLLEEVYYFGISFPVARGYSAEKNKNVPAGRRFTFNPVLGVIIFALGLGLLLNYQNVPRPLVLGTCASALMLVATIFFLFAIGLSLHLGRVWRYFTAGLGMCLIKFLGIPAVIILLAKTLDLAAYDNGLALKTVAILSSMPVAMTALVPPSLFDLDLDLANACWIVTTGALVLELPFLLFILPML